MKALVANLSNMLSSCFLSYVHTHTHTHTHAHKHTVEFPAVLLDLCTGEIAAEFQQYVQPQENPRLSKFCRELTGITQVDTHHSGRYDSLITHPHDNIFVNSQDDFINNSNLLSWLASFPGPSLGMRLLSQALPYVSL